MHLSVELVVQEDEYPVPEVESWSSHKRSIGHGEGYLSIHHHRAVGTGPVCQAMAGPLFGAKFFFFFFYPFLYYKIYVLMNYSICVPRGTILEQHWIMAEAAVTIQSAAKLFLPSSCACHIDTGHACYKCKQ